MPGTRPGMTGHSLSPHLRIPDRLPYLGRCQRRIKLLDAELAERIHHAVGDARRAADGTGFAAALGAERIGAARRGIVEGDSDRRDVVGARHAVILVARGQQLAFLAVGDAFIERLADALRDAAMDLAGHQHRIDGNADVIDRGIAHHLADAGFGIDLDFADMRAVRPARAVDLAFAVDAE